MEINCFCHLKTKLWRRWMSELSTVCAEKVIASELELRGLFLFFQVYGLGLKRNVLGLPGSSPSLAERWVNLPCPSRNDVMPLYVYGPCLVDTSGVRNGREYMLSRKMVQMRSSCGAPSSVSGTAGSCKTWLASASSRGQSTELRGSHHQAQDLWECFQ